MPTLMDTAWRSTRCMVSIVALFCANLVVPGTHNAISFPFGLGGLSCLESDLAASCKPLAVSSRARVCEVQVNAVT